MTQAKAARLPKADPASDPEIVRRVIAGETALYAVLMRRHNQRVFRAARGIVRQDHEAEDVAQQAYVTAFHKLASFRGESSFVTWLTTIAVHEALGRLRRNKHQQGHLELVQSGADVTENRRPDTPEDLAQRRQVAQLLEHSIDGLPDGLRLVFMMRDVQELSTAETAASLELSEEAVRVRLHRARARMRALLASVLQSAPDAFHFAGDRCDRIVASVMESVLADQQTE